MIRMLLPQRGNNIQRGANKGRRALLDVGDQNVATEHAVTKMRTSKRRKQMQHKGNEGQAVLDGGDCEWRESSYSLECRDDEVYV
jgi:hypothetical protein